MILLTTGMGRHIVFKATIFCSVTLCSALLYDTHLNLFYIHGIQLENILQLLTGLQLDICYVIKTRVGFEIAEMTRF